VIFDLDGTILEDEDEYGKAFNKVLNSLGVDSKTDFPQTKGIGVKENWNDFVKKYKIVTKKTPEILAKETQDAYLQEISEVTIRPGFIDFIDGLKEKGVCVGLGTSNSWEQTDKILDTVNLQGVFDAITTADEVVYGKPDPDIFTVTADKLGEERGECLVIEDSPSGVEAGRRAGMKVIAIASSEQDLKDLSKADYTVENFSEISPKIIDEL
jgi:16S rRNA pseudouridine516 synthase